MNEDPLRSVVASEIHARPIVPMPRGWLAHRLVFVGVDFARMAALFPSLQQPIDPEELRRKRRITFERSDDSVVLELHNEFLTATVVTQEELNDDDLRMLLGDLVDLPVIAACVVRTHDADKLDTGVVARLDPLSACYSRLENNLGEIACDYRADHRGFVRYELATSEMTESSLASVVRRVLEIDTYSALVLIGLPRAREILPELSQIDLELSNLMQNVKPDLDSVASTANLHRLGGLQVQLAKLLETSRFRFGASRAYGDILKTRLHHLYETPIVNFRTHSRYLLHRVDPAIATIAATEARLRAASEQVRTAGAVLDTGLAQQIQRQNQGILSSILRTSSMHYRLQRTVEGLSIVAITYYAISLLKYELEGLEAFLLIDKLSIIAFAIPALLAIVWTGLRFLHFLNSKSADAHARD